MSSSSTDSTTVNDTNTINVNTTSIFDTITYSSGRVEWSDDQIAVLIEQRRSRNFEYHYQIAGRSRKRFWNSVANKVNERCRSNYSGKQCQTKFNGLVTSYHDQLLVIANNPRGARSRAGAIYFEVMNTRFWEKPDDQFVQASIGVNKTQHRRNNRRNARGSRNTQNTNTNTQNTEDRNVDDDNNE
ncbi:probable autophagy-related protein 17 [Rhizophagus irregularis DAOM 181602=DAOM 197198]|nr:probable autophagy-related protein 17 [Rhizophagus irregularis DAOM 181602=DAOM 197198]